MKSNSYIDNKLIIEELSLSDNLEDLVEPSYYLDEELNIFYSYPYFTLNNYDYQYRLTLDNNSLLLEEVKCDESSNDFVVLKEVCKLDLETGLSLIYDNFDIREKEEKKITVESDFVNYDIQESDNPEKILENNKSVVLLELYKSIQ